MPILRPSNPTRIAQLRLVVRQTPRTSGLPRSIRSGAGNFLAGADCAPAGRVHGPRPLVGFRVAASWSANGLTQPILGPGSPRGDYHERGVNLLRVTP